MTTAETIDVESLTPQELLALDEKINRAKQEAEEAKRKAAEERIERQQQEAAYRRSPAFRLQQELERQRALNESVLAEVGATHAPEDAQRLMLLLAHAHGHLRMALFRFAALACGVVERGHNELDDVRSLVAAWERIPEPTRQALLCLAEHVRSAYDNSRVATPVASCLPAQSQPVADPAEEDRRRQVRRRFGL